MKMKNACILGFSALLALIAFRSTGFAAEKDSCGGACCGAESAAKAETGKTIGDPYALKTCIVSGKPLGSMGSPVVYNYNGREIRFCCQGCVPPFEKDPAAFLKKIDQEVIRDQTAVYPLETCVVSGGKLTGMGEPVNYVYNNRLVRFCCPDCVAAFEKNPVDFIAKIDQAVIAKQAEKYPLQTCVVSGEKLGSMGKPVHVVVGNRLVKLCCEACQAELDKDPARFLSKLNGNTAAGGVDSSKAKTDHSAHAH